MYRIAASASTAPKEKSVIHPCHEPGRENVEKVFPVVSPKHDAVLLFRAVPRPRPHRSRLLGSSRLQEHPAEHKDQHQSQPQHSPQKQQSARTSLYPIEDENGNYYYPVPSSPFSPSSPKKSKVREQLPGGIASLVSSHSQTWPSWHGDDDDEEHHDNGAGDTKCSPRPISSSNSSSWSPACHAASEAQKIVHQLIKAGALSAPILMQAQPDGSSPVCQCCFEELEDEPEQYQPRPAQSTDRRMITCIRQGEGQHPHTFCGDCVRRYVEEWVYSGTYAFPLRQVSARCQALPCLSADCRQGSLSHGSIQKVVSAATLGAYQQKMALAHFPPRFKAISTPCTLARRPARPYSDSPSTRLSSPNTLLDLSYHEAEEALTEAKLRRCPNCHSQFLKEADSCNKVQCPSCRTAMCYICRKEVAVRGYDHFCQHAYDTCSQCAKCPLWVRQDDAWDEARLREVATDVANRVWEASLLQQPSLHNHHHHLPPPPQQQPQHPSGDVSSASPDVLVLDVERLLRIPSSPPTTAP